MPPRLYGGIERVVSYLTEELVRQGHEVTLFASGDSKTAARLVPVVPTCLWHDSTRSEPLPHHLRMMDMVFEDLSRFDVLHFHTDYLHFPLLRRSPFPSVTTIHRPLSAEDYGPLLAHFDDMPLVSISDDQRRPVPWAAWEATIHHGLPRDLHTFRPRGGGYLAFLGRVAEQKGLDRAIEIARLAGRPLRVAAKLPHENDAYFRETIEPLLSGPGASVELVGEVGGAAKDAFLGGADALLFPIDWEEPFGLVMIEALACGTPVIAFPRGSVPEVIRDGVTGFIVDGVDEAARAVGKVAGLSREACRRDFEKRFDASRMCREHVDVYRRLVRRFARPRHTRAPVLSAAYAGAPARTRRRAPGLVTAGNAD